jgi:adenine-specific DNA-methyltransferase
MARKSGSGRAAGSGRQIGVETLKHPEAKRKNIPTAEFESVMQAEDKSPVRVAYERRNRDLDPQLVWRGKDEQDWSDLIVQAPPLYIQEKVHPKVLIDDLMRQSRERAADKPGAAPDLFADFNGLPDKAAQTEFYKHDAHWSNRMILGDSLAVMASLAEREGLRGQVQCIFIDPPYGIRFNSNFQWSTTTRDVKESGLDHVTREPEQVRAFRDTWRDGIHSYLTYLRDRISVARDLLTESGSIFVQIGDENVHRVRTLLDETMGPDCFVCAVLIQKTGSITGDFIQSNTDTILWYSRRKDAAKFRPLFIERDGEPAKHVRALSSLEREDYSAYPLTSDGYRETTTISFKFEGEIFHPGKNRHWGVRVEELDRVGRAGRIVRQEKQVRMRYFWDDYPVRSLGSIWADVGGATGKVYIVQTAPKVLSRLGSKPNKFVEPRIGW